MAKKIVSSTSSSAFTGQALGAMDRGIKLLETNKSFSARYYMLTLSKMPLKLVASAILP